jgi:hypothetical protein
VTVTRTAVSEAHTRAKAARSMLAELEKKKAGDLALFHSTRNTKYSLRAWLLEDEIGRAREALRRAEREVEHG